MVVDATATSQRGIRPSARGADLGGAVGAAPPQPPRGAAVRHAVRPGAGGGLGRAACSAASSGAAQHMRRMNAFYNYGLCIMILYISWYIIMIHTHHDHRKYKILLAPNSFDVIQLSVCTYHFFFRHRWVLWSPHSSCKYCVFVTLQWRNAGNPESIHGATGRSQKYFPKEPPLIDCPTILGTSTHCLNCLNFDCCQLPVYSKRVSSLLLFPSRTIFQCFLLFCNPT